MVSSLPVKDSSSFTLRVHACPPPGFFKPSRFHPQRNNIRTDWYTGSQTSLSGKIVFLYDRFVENDLRELSYHLQSLFLNDYI